MPSIRANMSCRKSITPPLTYEASAELGREPLKRSLSVSSCRGPSGGQSRLDYRSWKHVRVPMISSSMATAARSQPTTWRSRTRNAAPPLPLNLPERNTPPGPQNVESARAVRAWGASVPEAIPPQWKSDVDSYPLLDVDPSKRELPSHHFASGW